MRVLYLYGFSLFLCACNQQEPSTEEPQGQRILFYPRANVYRDEERNRWYRYDSAAGSWEQAKQLPEAEARRLDRAVLIAQPQVPVYRDNGQHKLVYGTSRYAAPDDLKRKRYEDSLAEVPPPPVQKPEAAPAPAEEPRRKTKVGRWLQKVFGKKKND